MAPEGRNFLHPPSARTRAASSSAMRLTALWLYKLPTEKPLCRQPSVCSSLYGHRDLPVTQWAPGVKSVAWRNGVINVTRASDLSPDPASGNLLHHRNAKYAASNKLLRAYTSRKLTKGAIPRTRHTQAQTEQKRAHLGRSCFRLIPFIVGIANEAVRAL